MAKIKLEEGNVIIKFFMLVGKYEQKVKYKIDLTNTEYYFEQAKEWNILDWELIEEEIPDLVEEMKILVKENIINNRNVAGSYRRSGMTSQAERAEKFLENNEIIQDFLFRYKI